MRLVFFGLSLTSSWGNGHATTYRGLLHGLQQLGHEIEFFERDLEWYAAHRDLPNPPQARLHLYQDWNAIRPQARACAAAADAVIVGSYFPDATAALDDLIACRPARLAFYDIDTPITLDRLKRSDCNYLRADQIPRLDLYLSFTGGPVLDELHESWGARCVRPLYCACDEGHYRPTRQSGSPAAPPPVALSFLGTYAPDREQKFNHLLLEPARRLPGMRFEVAGSMYPRREVWPSNVGYTFHLDPSQHPSFYASSRFTLNLTRQAMVQAGYSPSIRLFEAAACGTAIISDPWPGLEAFFSPGRDILIAPDTATLVDILHGTSPEKAAAIGTAARARVSQHHTCRQRAAELLSYIEESASSPLAPVHSTPIPIETGS